PRNDVGAHAAQPDDHGALADADELANRSLAAEHHVVTDADMTSEHHVVGERHPITDLAIVRHVRAHHEETAVADFGDAAVLLGPDIHRHVFADVAIAADDKAGRAALVFDRLRRRSKRCERIDHRARADAGVAGDVDVSNETNAVADHNVWSDHAVGPDR